MAVIIAAAVFPLVAIFFILFLNLFGMVGPGGILGFLVRVVLKVVVFALLIGPLLLVPFIRNDMLLLARIIQEKFRTRSFAVLGLFAGIALLILGLLYGYFFG